MAQSMKDVKAITIPEGSVKKIEDSNGNIIWGSYDAFPYRRLEYLHFNGTNNYIQTNFYGGTTTINHQCEFTVEDTPTGTNARTLIGIYDGSVVDALRRFYPIWRGTNGIRCSIGNSWSSYATDFSLNDKLKVSGTLGLSGTTVRIYWYLANQTTGGTIIGSAAPLLNTTAGNLNTTAALRLGCQITQTGVAANYWLGKIYNYQRRQTNASGTLLTNYVPVQRKSDGKYGMYDTVSKTFLILQGTQNSTSAGPIVDEYWNLQA